ncbi:MAG: hypothetical protein U0736_08795 [Gemmataceae bacterium]
MPVLVERAADAVRDTRVFVRGNRLTKDESVQPGLPDFLAPGLPADRRLTRLDLGAVADERAATR